MPNAFEDLFGEGVPKANVADWLQRAKQNKQPCVYILECKGSYKIGRTENLTKRLKSLQVGNPFAIKVTHVIFTEDYIKVEQALHRIFAGDRTRDEWFALSMRDLATIRSMSVQMILQQAERLKPAEPQLEPFVPPDQMSFDW